MFLTAFSDELTKLASPIGRQGPTTSVPHEKRRAPTGPASSARISNETAVDNRRARHMGMPKGPVGLRNSGTRYLAKHEGRKMNWGQYLKDQRNTQNNVRAGLADRDRTRKLKGDTKKLVEGKLLSGGGYSLGERRKINPAWSFTSSVPHPPRYSTAAPKMKLGPPKPPASPKL